MTALGFGVELGVLTQAEQLVEISGIQLAKPRVVGRQQHRASATSADETDSDYFKRSIWLPYLDAVIVHMQDKFSRTSQIAYLLPSVLTGKKVEMENFKKVFEMYDDFIGCYKKELYEELLNFLAYRESGSRLNRNLKIRGTNKKQQKTMMMLTLVPQGHLLD